MTDIVIRIETSVQPYNGDEAQCIINCSAIYGKESSDLVPFDVMFDRSDLASTINTAIKNGAIAACSGVSVTVGALDKKTLIGGAVGL